MAYATNKQFHLHSVRGVVLSKNCIAISWGFFDGITIFYRRVRILQYLNGNGWEMVWMAGRSIFPCAKYLPDLFHKTNRICLIIIIIIIIINNNNNNNMIFVTTLAISRLGGYIELVPLPTQMWAGPLLTTDNFGLPKPKRKRQHPQQQQQQQQQQHYVLGRNIACLLSTIALTTCEYHTDIYAAMENSTTSRIERFYRH
jgi:hypothetical protein